MVIKSVPISPQKMEFDLSRSYRPENTLRHHKKPKGLILYSEIMSFCCWINETQKYILWAQCRTFVM